jgi:signal peptidase II
MSKAPPGKARYLLITTAVVILDQLSKGLIESYLPLHQTRTLIPGLLNLAHVRNSGVAFGMFASHGDRVGTMLLSALGLVALALVGLYFWRAAREERRLLLSLALILGGAVGNLIDRMASGSVTDFIDFYLGSYHWHTFNVADSAITIGIILMTLDIFWPATEPESVEAIAE